MASLGLKFSRFLLNYRAKRGRTQQWLADVTNLSRATINRWEARGAGAATLDEVEQIAHSLKVNVWEALGNEAMATAGTESPIAIPYDLAATLAQCTEEQLDAIRAVLEGFAAGREKRALSGQGAQELGNPAQKAKRKRS